MKAWKLLLPFVVTGLVPCQSWSADEPPVVTVTDKTLAALEPSVISGGVRADAQTPLGKYYEAGRRALEQRRYGEATLRFKQAQREIERGRKNPATEVLVRVGMAEIQLADERFDDALKTLSSISPQTDAVFGKESPEAGRVLYDTALAHHKLGHDDKATAACTRALAVQEKILGASHHDVGVTLALLASIQLAQGFHSDALATYPKSLKILEAFPGYERMDYADAIYGFGMAKLAAGDERSAAESIKVAQATKDDAVRMDKNISQKGLVRYIWKEGVPGCKQVYDHVYPLKYMLVNGVRVAATLVKSQKHVVALVSLANCTPHPVSVAVGPVSIDKTKPGQERLVWCDPNLIDLTLEEEYVQNYTWSRRWISHILKTHRIPGYLKNGVLDPDNFYGSNVFGMYGYWDGTPRTVSPVVTREQFYFDEKIPLEDIEKSMAHTGSQQGFRPAYIEPGDARTGVTVCLYKHSEKLKVTVRIGNAQAEFPFAMPVGQEGR